MKSQSLVVWGGDWLQRGMREGFGNNVNVNLDCDGSYIMLKPIKPHTLWYVNHISRKLMKINFRFLKK